MNYLDKTGLAHLWAKIKAKIPTKVSQLTNDEGYLTEHQDISGKQDVLTAGKDITIENNVINSTSANSEIVSTLLEGTNFTGGCRYYKSLGLCYCRIYVTGKSLATGSRHLIATVDADYAPGFRTALAVDGLQDYSGVLKASIEPNGEIGLITSVAKESGDDIYISGVWYVASQDE